MTEGRPWLFALATQRRAKPSAGNAAYDPERQLSVVQEGGCLLLAINAMSPPVSKKADIEKGEDLKDTWVP
jgi:hypothetical protein